MTKQINLRQVIQDAIDTGELLSAPQVAEISKVSENTVTEWCRSGKLVAIKLPQFKNHHIASEWLIVRADLVRYRIKRGDYDVMFRDPPKDREGVS